MIKIDCREHALIQLCKTLIETDVAYKGLEVIVEALPIGDIILSKDNDETILIERKSISDLAASIKDGRYEEQSYRLNGLSHHNHNIVYLIEGDISRVTKYKIDKKTMYSAMFSLNFYKGFSVLRTTSIEETAQMICHMAYKLRKTTDKYGYYSSTQNEVATMSTDSKINASYCNVIKKVKKENITPENIGEIMLCQIPGISSISAIAIMKEFHSLQNLCNKIKEDTT